MALFLDSISEYRVLDYSPAHNQLLIRSMKDRNRNYNIDIIFKGALVLLVPATFTGLEISIAKDTPNSQYFIGEYGLQNTNDYRLFSLKNAKDRFYFVNAMCFGVYHNTLDILATSIGRYDMENFGENVLWFPD